MADLFLAIGHHLAIFALFGVLTAELLLVRRGMDAAAIRKLAAIDAAYGGLALLVIVLGVCRVVFAAKGWVFYVHNGFFWAKMAVFAAIGVLSAAPTLALLKARRTGVLADDEVRKVRAFLHAQAALFPLLLIFAAAMARGYGAF